MHMTVPSMSSARANIKAQSASDCGVKGGAYMYIIFHALIMTMVKRLAANDKAI